MSTKRKIAQAVKFDENGELWIPDWVPEAEHERFWVICRSLDELGGIDPNHYKIRMIHRALLHDDYELALGMVHDALFKHYGTGQDIALERNVVHVGDNLEIMKKIGKGAIDLIATDPPFDKGQTFKGKDFQFKDIYNDFLAYMHPRMEEMHRILAPTGSLYWHCDPSISHYIKIELDKIFGPENFRNEIVWCYAPVGSGPTQAFARKHDTILFYGKSYVSTYNKQFTEMTDETKRTYNKVEEGTGRIYRNHGDRTYYLDEYKGRPVPDWWTDVPSFATASQAKERVKYPTQKPVALYERMILASTAPDDIVLDPFCGSGTTLVAAAQHGRQWIGIDKNDVGDLIKSRMENNNG